MHIDLNRTFWPVKDESDYDPDSYRYHSAFGMKADDWSELLQNKRVVILAKAGAGKSAELREAARTMRGEGKSAFFFRIEELAESDVSDAFEEGSLDEMTIWKQKDSPGWFFLDSVDEARLVDAKGFERALKRFARALDNSLDRAHIFISSRGNDWKANADYELVVEKLPIKRSETQLLEQPKDKTARVSQRGKRTVTRETSSDSEVKIVRLAPLNNEQTRLFVAEQGVPDANAFVDAIIRADIAPFAETPQDLLDLIVYWERYHRFGTHAEMVAFNIDKKLLEPKSDRDEICPLPVNKARAGAQAIAAAMTLTRKNVIVLPDSPVAAHRAAQAIDAAEILPEWESKERKTLLGRAIFEVATYGTVRIYERRTREYLTSQWLLHLLASGKNRRSIENLIFAKRYGADLVIPSMKPVAAWLAIKDDRIRERLVEVAPEVLIGYGDPASLPIVIRKKLLRKYSEVIFKHKTDDESFDLDSLKRLADPELADTINELLEQYDSHEEVRQLLLRMVWQGELNACADITMRFAVDTKMDRYTRVGAIRAINAIGNDDQKQLVVQTITSNPNTWDTKLLAEVIDAFFPQFISPDLLLEIIESVTPPKRYSVSDLSYVLEKIFENTCPLQLCLLLLKRLLELLELEPYECSYSCKISKQYKWLFPHAAALVKRLITSDPAAWQDESLLRTIELAWGIRFHDGDEKGYGKLFQGIVIFRPELRHLFFWRAIVKEQSKLENEGKYRSVFWSAYVNTPWLLKEEDFEYFVEEITTSQELDNRLIALSAALMIWRNSGISRKELSRLRRLVKGEPELGNALREFLSPPQKSDEMKRHDRSMRDLKKRQDKQLKKQEEQRNTWIAGLQQNSAHLRHVSKSTVDKVFGDLYWLAHEISKHCDDSKFGKGDWKVLIAEFDLDVAEAARDGLMAYWRLYQPKLKSEENTNSIANGFIVGMMGLTIETKIRPDWARKLSVSDAKLAARYMTLEMNGLPLWAPQLLDAHPDVLNEVMHRELVWEYETPAESAAPYHMLQVLRYGSEELRSQLLPFVLNLLNKQEAAHAQTLEAALTLALQWPELDKQAFSGLAQTRCAAALDEGRFLTWLVAWLCVDAGNAFIRLEGWLEEVIDSEVADQRMISFCNALFDHRSPRFGNVHRDFERLGVLRELALLVYGRVRINDDVRHEGVYTPNARDNAETVRGYLLEKIYNLSGPAAYNTLLEFSRVLPHERSRERMLVLAHKRAAEDAEFEPWQSVDVVLFSTEAEKQPRSSRELFDLTCSRLDDIRLNLEDGRYSQAQLLLNSAIEEPKIRNWFADELRKLNHGKYSVSSEDEFADATRPDLNIHAPSVNYPIVIELKKTDNWSVPELSERLRNQLVGQYMRDTHSQFGIYLLAWQGKWKRKTDENDVPFEKLVNLLQDEADTIVCSRYDIEEIRVVGIDLTKRKRKN
ncbi:MAG: hypothetical protein PHF56_21930 [Desulfuromonadaceae bacterium]|nr:hypothetical protein [Desulfuromonadaceae bacterium]